MKITKLLLFIIISITSTIWAGETGKIAGTVTDKSTGEPLIGASVIVVGTSLGAASDIDGHYTILFVPPGVYNIQVTYVGYNKTTVNDVRVSIDQTAYIDVALESQDIRVEELIVYAERTVIKKDVATSVVSVSDDEIKALPINNVVSALGLQAGVRGGWGSFGQTAQAPTFTNKNYSRGTVSVQNDINIRGGGGETILFLQDGITLRDPRNNDPLSQIPMSSIKEVSVERGGFNAEYGQVRSGVVNVTSRAGHKSEYSASFQIRMLPPGRKYYKPGGSGNPNLIQGIFDIHDPNSFVMRPFFDPAVCWTGTNNGAWDEFMQNEYPKFEGGWNAVSKQLLSDNNPDNDLTPQQAQRVFEYVTRKRQINNEPDYDIDAGFGGPVPFISSYLGDLRFFGSYRRIREVLLFPLTRDDYSEYTANVNVISDISPKMKLQLTGLMGKQYTISDNNYGGTGNYYYPRYAQNVADRISSISATSDMFGMFSDYNYALTDIGTRSLGAKMTHSFRPNAFYEVSLENLRRNYHTRPTSPRDETVITEVVPGFLQDLYPFGYSTKDKNRSIPVGNAEFSALARDNSVVSSTSFKADYTSQVNFQNLIKAGIEFSYNDLNFDFGTIASGGQASEEYANRVLMHVFPIRAAAYIQDKVEFQEFTINAGLRLDYDDSKINWWSINPFDPNFYTDKYKPTQTYNMERSESRWILSPRVGVAHPITENAKLFFNYGHYSQIAQYESLFRLQRDQRKAVTTIGDPNLPHAKTISYELGFDYLLGENYLIQVAGFYNDISNQQDLTTYQASSLGFHYTLTTANNYQDIRGFEFTIRKTTGRWWLGYLNYTYQVSTNGHFGSPYKYDNPGDQKDFDQETVNLYQNRQNPQPYARANISFNIPDDFGPEVFGYKILAGWGLNTIIDWQEGFWTSWNPNGNPAVTYNVQSIDYFNTYLKFNKQINIGKFGLQLFVDVNNVFNTLRLWNTQDFDYMSSLHFSESRDYQNIPGNDKVGEYRELDVDYQPMVRVTNLPTQGVPESQVRAWYYLDSEGSYYQWANSQWSKVPQDQVDKALDEKAYINMPRASTYWFLDPRQIYFGVKLSFNFD